MKNRSILERIISIVIICALILTMTISEPISVKAESSVIDKAIAWAVEIANDDSHGYSQINRWGPDYDCSSFVIQAFKNAGADIDTTKVSYTGNMKAYFTSHGFVWIPWSQIGDQSGLQRGDILLCEGSHTEIYIGDGKNVGAHTDGGYPQTGDQTGKEISVTAYYNSASQPWSGVLRYMGVGNSCSCSTSYAGTYIVDTEQSSLIMRSGHGTGYSIITTIPEGTEVKVTKGNGSWAHVEWNGYSGYCSMEYLKKKYNNPKGTIDSISGGVGSVDVRGWAFDLDDTSTSIYIDVYIGGPAGSGVPCHTIVANRYRPDVNKVYSVGDNHGYSEKIYTDYTGLQSVYVYAINIGGGENVFLGTKQVNIEENIEITDGWHEESGSKYYYENGNKITGWKKIDDKWYYFENNGILQNSKWIKTSNKWYYVDNSGVMQTAKWLKLNDKWYYVDGNGVMQTGWQKLGNKWYYFNTSGVMQSSKWLYINNKWYHLDANGVMETSKWISGTYYVKADGTMAVSEWVDNGKYYVDADGKWVKGAKK